VAKHRRVRAYFDTEFREGLVQQDNSIEEFWLDKRRSIKELTMNLDETTKQKVAAWIQEGLKLSEIQSKLASELGQRLTYMEVRLLVDDLRLTPKDQAPPQPTPQFSAQPVSGQALSAEEAEEPLAEELAPADPAAAAPGTGKISVSVDRVARPGALVSGTVTFSDSNSAGWYLDQLGRLGIVPKQTGYRPAPEDLQAFQLELQNQLQKLGF